MKVVTFKTEVAGIEVLVEGFTGVFIREYKGNEGLCADIYSDDGSQRIIPIEHVKDIGDEAEPEFDGEAYTIRCIDCKGARTIKPQHLHQIKRCKKCQRIYTKRVARERIQRKRGKS